MRKSADKIATSAKITHKQNIHKNTLHLKVKTDESHQPYLISQNNNVTINFHDPNQWNKNILYTYINKLQEISELFSTPTTLSDIYAFFDSFNQKYGKFITLCKHAAGIYTNQKIHYTKSLNKFSITIY